MSPAQLGKEEATLKRLAEEPQGRWLTAAYLVANAWSWWVILAAAAFAAWRFADLAPAAWAAAALLALAAAAYAGKAAIERRYPP